MRAWIRNLLKVKDTPEALARGLAVGFFFGVSFFWGLQIALAVLVSHLVRGNKVVAAAVTAISNPLTSLPLYTLCYFIGHLLIGGEDTLPDFATVHSIEGFLALGPHFFVTMLVGTTLVGVVGGVAVYFSSNRLLAALRRWHSARTAGEADRRRDEAKSSAGASGVHDADSGSGPAAPGV
jgi:hypothetical protein